MSLIDRLGWAVIAIAVVGVIMIAIAAWFVDWRIGVALLGIGLLAAAYEIDQALPKNPE